MKATRTLEILAVHGAVLMSAIVPAVAAPTFTYTEHFNGYAEYAVPNGWVSQDGVAPQLPPVVTFSDPVNWSGLAVPPGGPVNYGVAWSGGNRFTFIHPAESIPASLDHRTVSAWYEGNGEANYPLALQSNSLQAEFDLVLRTGTACVDSQTSEMFPGDGATFALQPVTNLAMDATRVGTGYGALGWGGIGGLSIEFDLFGDTGADPSGADAGNHVGLNVRVMYAGGNTLTSLVTHLDPPVALAENTIPRFTAVGDNNQPLHVTVFYNDPHEGGAGVVRVYLKVDPANKDINEPGTPLTYGMGPGDGPHGKLVLQACAGAWPTASAIFGFTASTGGCDAVIQFDNVSVTADDEGGVFGNLCTLPDVPTPTGPVVTIDAAAKVAACGEGTLGSPGWNVASYQPTAFGIPAFKASIYHAEFFGTGPISAVTGETDLNYDDGDCSARFGSDRLYPGITAGGDNYGIQATAYMCFPQAGAYTFDVESDDGFEFVVGAGVAEQLVSIYLDGRGCGSSTRATVQIPEAGVYPVRMLQFEGSGGAGLEFRHVAMPASPLLEPVPYLVAATDHGVSGLPFVYGTLGGQPAPLGDFSSPVIPIPVSEKVAGSGTGASGFTIKTVSAPEGIAIISGRDDDGDTTARRLLDAMQDRAGGAVYATLNFRDTSGGTPQPDGAIPGGVAFPGVTGDNFASRGTGFATFPAAGVYTLWLDWDDHVHLEIGGQKVLAATSSGQRLVHVEIPEAGTYPIRLEHVEYLADARVELGQYVTGVGLVPLNGTGSSVAVHTAATSGAYTWPPHGRVIPAARKVANVGEGVSAGWNAVLAKAINVGAGTPPVIDKGAYGTMLIENNHVDLTPGVFPSGSDAPGSINYSDAGETPSGERFTGNRTIDVFGTVVNSAGGNDNLGISATGYIQFPTAGNYALNFNADDGALLWIGGVIVTAYPFSSAPMDATPAIVHIEQAGLYDIRVDYFEHDGGMSFEVFQYRPDGTAALINSASSTVTVYRSLRVAPASAAYANPILIPGSAKAAAVGAGTTPGFRVRTVERNFAGGDGNNAFGGDTLRDLAQASELLDGVIGEAPSLNQPGTLVADEVVGEIAFASAGDYPGHPNGDDFAVRITGYLELAAGGYLFEVDSDNGFEFWIGGQHPKTEGWNAGRSGSLKGAIAVPFYFTVAEAGLYKFVIEQFEHDGTESCYFNQLMFINSFLTSHRVNGTGPAVRVYADAYGCHHPVVDTDGDTDVDLADFHAIQQCFRGAGEDYPPNPAYCVCLDRNDDGDVDLNDVAAFTSCASGPGVGAAAGCDAVP
jgi:hypothetical protein